MIASTTRSAVVKNASRLGRRAASGIASKYSNALFSAALGKSPQTLTKVQSELAAVATAIKDSPALGAFIENPTLSAKDRESGLKTLLTAAAKKEPLSEVTKNLFSVLSENRRLGETPGVIQAYGELVAQYKGELDVTITSAAPLPQPTLTKLEGLLKQSQAGQKAKLLKISNKVNPDVLGGIVVDFGDKTIDLSVSSRVNKLNNLLSQTI